ncbi:histone deacetylase 9-B isoform X3 [Stigmatopora nigra]
MLQTIYEGESSFSTTDGRAGVQLLPNQGGMHNVNSSGEIKSDIPLSVEPLSPLDLRTDLRMLGPGSDPGLWERQLQQELLLIQKQQQIQKQLLISEFQKQHEKLTRQHQAQLQEHLKLQQELQAMKQQQELAEKERRLEQQQNQQHQQNQLEKEQERHRRELHISSLSLRAKERSRESAVASTEVKQKLQDFLLSKSAKDPASNGVNHSFIHHPKLWYRSSHHTSLDQSSPPLGGMSPTCHYTLPSPVDGKDDFPLRKTASEPNLKVRSRLKQKVAERRSSPMLKRKDGNLVTPYKKRALELMDSTPTKSAPGSGPSSPIGASSALGAENGPSSLPTTTRTERWPSQPRLFRPESSMSVLSLYTSPSLPNISFGLPTASSPISAPVGLKDRSIETKTGLPGHHFQNGLESRVSSSHQALLQHLLQKEQMRQQKMLSTGAGSLPSHPPSPLTIKDRTSSSRPKLPKHRPLNRTQSAPLPQNTLAQLVIQQQHQHFLEKQKQYQQQIHINKLLSKSIEQLRQPNAHLQESEEEQEELLRREQLERMQEDRLPPGGVIRKLTLSGNGSSVELPGAHYGVIKVKEEPLDSEDEMLEAERSAYLHQVKGRLVIRAMI